MTYILTLFQYLSFEQRGCGFLSKPGLANAFHQVILKDKAGFDSLSTLQIRTGGAVDSQGPLFLFRDGRSTYFLSLTC